MTGVEAGLVAGVVGYVAVVAASWGGLNQQIKDARAELQTIKKYLGMTNGDTSPFMRRSECEVHGRSTEAANRELRERVHELERQLAELGRHHG